jgi:O-antigen/teichoic acid export membrane protein
MSLTDRIKQLSPSGNPSFSRNVIILMTGTIIAQAIPLAVSPFLARIFSPEDFGLFALYFSISQIICVFITGRYESAIILPEDDDDSVNIVSLSVFITFLVTIVSLLLILVSRFLLEELLKRSGLYNYILLMPLTVFSIGIYNTFNLWLNRRKHFNNISAGKIVRSVFSSGLSIGFGFTLVKSGGLIIADTIGQFIAGSYVFFRSLKYDRFRIKSISAARMKAMAKRYVQFPKFNVVSGFFEKGAGQIPVILLSSFFGASVTGFFSLSQRIIAAPGSLIGVSVGDVFRQHASIEFKENGNCHVTFLKLFRLLLIIAAVPFTVILLFSPFLFSFVFGAEWRIAGEYAQIMTVMFFLSFVVSPLSNMFIIAEKQNIDLIIQIILFSLVTLSFISGYKIFNHPKTALALYTIVYSIKYCVEFYLSMQFSKGKKVINPGIS